VGSWSFSGPFLVTLAGYPLFIALVFLNVLFDYVGFIYSLVLLEASFKDWSLQLSLLPLISSNEVSAGSWIYFNLYGA